ncbi:MAG: alpha/beta fold hydrolase [Anaerolineales bacterium]
MSAIIINSEIVHYEVLGRGRPLIYMHGWVGSWRYWIPSMQATSISFRSYAIDLWGFGDTSKANSRYGLEDQVRLLDNFLGEMGIGKIALIGHGLGAVVALMYANKHPRFVDRVMAIGFPMGENALNLRLTTSPPNELENWLLGGTTVSELARLESLKTDTKAIKRSIANTKNINLLALASNLNIPCLLVHGQNDPAVALPRGEQMGRLSGSTHHIVFEESGHYPMLTEPNKFNRLVTEFLALNSGESPRDLQLKEEWKRRVR